MDHSNALIKERDISLQAFLLKQLPMMNFNNEELNIAEFIVGCIDDNGFLSRSLLAITDDLLFKLNVEASEAHNTHFNTIQKLEPAGVAAETYKNACLSTRAKTKK